MKNSKLKTLMIEEVRECFDSINDGDIDMLSEEILKGRRVFLYGLGRERLMLQAFAMRLMHLGLNVHMVGDVTTPRIEKEDLFITSSGTGYLSTVEALLKIVQKQGASVVYLTSSTDSLLQKFANHTIYIKAQTMKDALDSRTSPQPMGALFEQSMLLLFELAVIQIKETLGVSEEEMEQNHSVLE